MIDRSDQPTLYRFAGTERTYGPRALDWVVATYGGYTNVLAAPKERSADPQSWRSVNEWATALPTAPASMAQSERMAALGVPCTPGLTYSSAAQLIEAAEAAKRVERGRRRPTALKLKRLAAAGIAAPPNANRAAVDRLLSQHALGERGAQLVEAGLALPLSGVTEENIHALESAVESLSFAVAQASERGLDYTPQYPLTAEAMTELATVLDEFWSIAGDLGEVWDGLVGAGALPRAPTARQRKAVLPALLNALMASTWSHDDASYLALGRRALAVEIGAS